MRPWPVPSVVALGVSCFSLGFALAAMLATILEAK